MECLRCTPNNDEASALLAKCKHYIAEQEESEEEDVPPPPPPAAGGSGLENLGGLSGFDDDDDAMEYDDNIEREAITWIEDMTGKTSHGLNPTEWLQDGVRVCTVMEKLVPGSCPKSDVQQSGREDHWTANVKMFVAAAKRFGAGDWTFGGADLTQGSNMLKVFDCIHALGAIARKRSLDVPEMQSTWKHEIGNLVSSMASAGEGLDGFDAPEPPPEPKEDPLLVLKRSLRQKKEAANPIIAETPYHLNDAAAAQGVLAHEIDVGMPCHAQGCTCPGFELHVWKKQCKHCNHVRNEHARGQDVDKSRDVRPLEFMEEDESDLGLDTTGFCYQYDENGEGHAVHPDQAKKMMVIDVDNDMYEGLATESNDDALPEPEDLRKTTPWAPNPNAAADVAAKKAQNAGGPSQAERRARQGTMNVEIKLKQEFRVGLPGKQSQKMLLVMYKTADATPGVGKVEVYEKKDTQGRAMPMATIRIKNIMSMELTPTKKKLPSLMLRDSVKGDYILAAYDSAAAGAVAEWYTALHNEWFAFSNANGHFEGAADDVVEPARRKSRTSMLLNLKKTTPVNSSKPTPAPPLQEVDEVVFFNADATPPSGARPSTRAAPQVPAEPDDVIGGIAMYQNTPGEEGPPRPAPAQPPRRPSAQPTQQRAVQPAAAPKSRSGYGFGGDIVQDAASPAARQPSGRAQQPSRPPAAQQQPIGRAQSSRPAATRAPPPTQPQPQQARRSSANPNPNAGGATSTGSLWDHTQSMRSLTYAGIVFDCDRTQAEMILGLHRTNIGQGATGLYLLRSSTRTLGAIVLSIYARGKIEHFNFVKNSAGKYVNSRGKVLGSLVTVIKYYRENQDGLPSTATQLVVP